MSDLDGDFAFYEKYGKTMTEMDEFMRRYKNSNVKLTHWINRTKLDSTAEGFDRVKTEIEWISHDYHLGIFDRGTSLRRIHRVFHSPDGVDITDEFLKDRDALVCKCRKTPKQTVLSGLVERFVEKYSHLEITYNIPVLAIAFAHYPRMTPLETVLKNGSTFYGKKLSQILLDLNHPLTITVEHIPKDAKTDSETTLKVFFDKAKNNYEIHEMTRVIVVAN